MIRKKQLSLFLYLSTAAGLLILLDLGCYASGSEVSTYRRLRLENAVKELENAVKDGNTTKVNRILRDPIVRSRVNSALILAADQGDVQMVRTILQRGANANARNEQGAPVIMRAIGQRKRYESSCLLERRLNVIRELIAAGADVNRPLSGTTTPFVDEGETPLMLAIKKGDPNIVRLLLENNADINAVDKRGKNALILAGLSGNIKILEMLKEAGVDIQQADLANIVSVLFEDNRYKSHIPGVITLLHEEGIRLPSDEEIEEALTLSTGRAFDTSEYYLEERKTEFKKLLEKPIYWARLKERVVSNAKALKEKGISKDMIMLILKLAFGGDVKMPKIQRAISEALRMSDEEKRAIEERQLEEAYLRGKPRPGEFELE